MSRIDPGLVLPNPNAAQEGLAMLGPSYALQQQQKIQRADLQAQQQERQATVDKLKQEFQEKRETYNARQRINALLQQKPDATSDELTAIGGIYALPDIKARLDQQTVALAQAKSKNEVHTALTKELQDAYSLEPDVSKHQALQREIVGNAFRNGQISQQDHDAITSGPPDTLDELKGHEAQLSRERAQLAADTERKLKEAKTLEANAKAAAEKFKTPGPEGLVNTENGQVLVPPKPQATDDRQKLLAAFEADPALVKQYGPGLIGLGKYEQAQHIAQAAAQGAATAERNAGNDPRLAKVPANLHKDVLDKVQKAEDAYTTAQQAADDMKTFIDSARSGNKVAYAYAPTEGVLTFNTGRGVKRVNMAEIGSYSGAGSLVDRIKGYLGKQASGASIPADVLKDMESIHAAVAENAQSARDRSIKSIDHTYNSNFGGSAAATHRYNPKSGKIEAIQ